MNALTGLGVKPNQGGTEAIRNIVKRISRASLRKAQAKVAYREESEVLVSRTGC